MRRMSKLGKVLEFIYGNGKANSTEEKILGFLAFTGWFVAAFVTLLFIFGVLGLW